MGGLAVAQDAAGFGEGFPPQRVWEYKGNLP